jgi:hypothetical protein
MTTDESHLKSLSSPDDLSRNAPADATPLPYIRKLMIVLTVDMFPTIEPIYRPGYPTGASEESVSDSLTPPLGSATLHHKHEER